MDCYDIWVDLRDPSRDVQFATAVRASMEHLGSEGLIEGHRLTRRKLGFGPEGVGEFHVRIETRDLARLDEAFRAAARRAPEVKRPHAAGYGAVRTFRAALYRDFPADERAGRGGPTVERGMG